MKIFITLLLLSVTAFAQPSLRDSAWSLASEGKFAQAAEAYQKVLAADPDDARSLTNLAWCYLELNRYQEAAETAKRAIALDPKATPRTTISGTHWAKWNSLRRRSNPCERLSRSWGLRKIALEPDMGSNETRSER